MIKRHFFLIAALVVIVFMASAVGFKLVIAPKGAAGGAPGAGAPAGGRGGAAPGGAPGGTPGGAGATGGRGGAGAPGGRGGAGRGGVAITPATIYPHTLADRLQVLGVAKGRQSITVTSSAAELVEAVRFRPGDRVAANQVLLELKRTEEDAGVIQAQTDLNLAKLNSDRWTDLANRGVASRSQAETFQATYEKAKASLDAARSRAGDRVIRAPFAGIIGLSDIAPGALISPGTAIATLDDTTIMRVDFDVPDRFLALVKEGGGITATTDAYPGERYSGRVAKLDARIDERTRTIKVRAEIPNPNGRLKPGMLMRVGVDRGTRDSPAAPEASVQFSGTQAYVYYIARRNGGMFAEQRNVTVGEVQDGLIEIRDGLLVCDQVVADGLNRVQPNQALTIATGARGGRGGPGAPGGRGGRGGPGGGQAAPGAGRGDASGAPAGPGAPGGRGGRSGGFGGARSGGETGAPTGASGRGGRGGGEAGGRGGRGGGAPGARSGAPTVNCPTGGPGGGQSGAQAGGGRGGDTGAAMAGGAVAGAPAGARGSRGGRGGAPGGAAPQ